jgi:Recombinase
MTPHDKPRLALVVHTAELTPLSRDAHFLLGLQKAGVRFVAATGTASLRQIAGALNARSIPTNRGGTWSAVQVKRVLDTFKRRRVWKARARKLLAHSDKTIGRRNCSCQTPRQKQAWVTPYPWAACRGLAPPIFRWAEIIATGDKPA